MNKPRGDHALAEEIAKHLDDTPSGGRGPGADAGVLLQQARNAGEGGLRAHYLAQAQRVIRKLDPARQGNLIQRLQAEVLALQGRGGDTKVAHVTPGEIVIPRSLQTPQLLAWLRAAAQAQGIDPSRLVVGSNRNAINPNTGQPEFLDVDGEEIEEITVPAWTPQDITAGANAAYTEAAGLHDPEVAQGVTSVFKNRLGLPGYVEGNPHRIGNNISEIVNAPHQFQGIGDPNSQPWRATQNPSTMTTDERNVYNQYQDVVRQQLSGQLPDNTGGATFFYKGEPSRDALKTMSSRPLEQTTQIGPFRFYKPK